jgi:hypothetical protein
MKKKKKKKNPCLFDLKETFVATKSQLFIAGE